MEIIISVWSGKYIILLVSMVIFYLLDGDININEYNSDIIEYPDLNTNIKKINKDKIFFMKILWWS